LYALRHQSRPPFVVVDFRITPPRARRTIRPTNRNTADGGNPPDPAGDPDAGGGGNPADAGGGRNPPDGRLSDKLIGREPEIYDGERAKVENFLTE
jgi:hypothetical protein